jgi:hypothetical protein
VPENDGVADRPQSALTAGSVDRQENAEIEETLDATVDAGKPAPGLSTPEVAGNYDPGRYQDATRSYIAYWLLGLLTLMVVGGFGMLLIVPEVTFDDLKSILELVFGPIVALVSAATGFYFGAQQPGTGKKP